MRHNEQSVFTAASEEDAAPSKAGTLLGEWRALLLQIGSPDSSVAFWTAPVDALPALTDFLEDYLNRILLPCDLPAIAEACGHARRGEWRELLAEDIRLEEMIPPSPFKEASKRIGRLHLARLRPLRDERTVQRYAAAVQSSQVHGWHTMVYGVTLAVYSLPLRQGLLYYSQATLSALAAAANRSKNFNEPELAELLSPLLARLPEAVAAALQQGELPSQVSMASDTAG